MSSPSRLALVRDAAGGALSGTALTLVTVACVAPGVGALVCGNADCFGAVAGAANGLEFGRFSAPKQVSTSVSALPKPSSGSLKVVCAVLISIAAAVDSFCMNCPSEPSSIITIFGPMANALASLRKTGAATEQMGRLPQLDERGSLPRPAREARRLSGLSRRREPAHEFSGLP